MIAPKTNTKTFPYLVNNKVISGILPQKLSKFNLSWLSKQFQNANDPQCNVKKMYLILTLSKIDHQVTRISRTATEPEYHLWKVRRPKCRPPWPADRILSGPRSSLSFKGLSTNPLLVFSVLFLTEFQEDFSLPKGCKQPPCCSCFCSS